MSIFDKLFYEGDWECVYRKYNDEPLSLSNEAFSKMEISSRYWCADPHIVKDGDAYYIFCEVMDRKISRGLLGIGKLRENGNSHIEKMIDLNCHTSYPNIFHYENQWYIVPETCDRRNIELYRAVSFPYEWEKDTELLTGIRAVDTTVFSMNNELFVFIYEPNGQKNELSIGKLDMKQKRITDIHHVWHYDGKLGRPAGNIYMKNGKYYRPTQYGVNFYGEKIISKKFEFDPDTFAYSEENAEEISAVELCNRPSVIGTHTYNICGEYEIYDILTKKFHPLRPLHLLMKKMKLGGYCFYARED